MGQPRVLRPDAVNAAYGKTITCIECFHVEGTVKAKTAERLGAPPATIRAWWRQGAELQLTESMENRIRAILDELKDVAKARGTARVDGDDREDTAKPVPYFEDDGATPAEEAAWEQCR